MPAGVLRSSNAHRGWAESGTANASTSSSTGSSGSCVGGRHRWRRVSRLAAVLVLPEPPSAVQLPPLPLPPPMCPPPGDEPPRTREVETATTKRTTETEDCAYAGRSSIPISSQAETDDGPWPSIARHRICRRYDTNGEHCPATRLPVFIQSNGSLCIAKYAGGSRIHPHRPRPRPTMALGPPSPATDARTAQNMSAIRY